MDLQTSELTRAIGKAIASRSGTIASEPHDAAFRLLNGFLEGAPHLALDVYGRTLVVQNHADPPSSLGDLEEAIESVLAQLPWLRGVLVKEHCASDEEARRGRLVHGAADDVDRQVREGGVAFALDLRLNRDSSLYLDTRNLRAWAFTRLKGARVLNTFAYTGSLGVAAAAGGAARVIQTDLNPAFLEVARRSMELNRLPVVRSDFRSGGFWEQLGRLKKKGSLFDAVFLDPPVFSSTREGTVDLLQEGARLINKVRPLVGDGGALIAVNNALFLSGADYLRSLEALGEYVKVEELIPVPDDCAGYPETRVGSLPADPAPFNHATKIAVLRLRRKDGRRASETLEP